MTDIDPKSDIELSTADGQVVVRVPLAGQVSGEWLRCYERLARATEVPVQAQARPDRAWIVVSVPADSNQKEVAATLDAARALIAEADAAGRAPSTAQTETIARDWWARKQVSVPRRPISKVEVVRTGIGTEKRWPLAGALILAIVIPLLLPSRFSLAPAGWSRRSMPCSWWPSRPPTAAAVAAGRPPSGRCPSRWSRCW